MSNLSTVFTTAIANTASYPGQSFFGSNNVKVFLASGTFVVPANVNQIRVRVHGAGGSGGGVAGSSRNRVASGGGGGGLAIKTLNVTPGASYAVTVGAGGAPVTLSAANAGNAGGTSSFGAVCSATGGGGGAAALSNSASNTAAGASGGTGSGGDLNFTGGGSGTASTTVTSGTYNSLAVTGGGSAASIFGNGFSSGAALINGGTYGSATEVIAASGGAGVGGASGAATNDTIWQNLCTGGGGTAGPSRDNNAVSSYQVQGPGFGLFYSVSAIPSTISFLNWSGPFSAMQNFCLYPAEVYNSFATLSAQTGLGANNIYAGSYPANAVNRFPGDILISPASPFSSSSYYTNRFSPPGTGQGANTPNIFATTTGITFAGVFGGGCGTGDNNNNGAKGGNATIGGGGGGCVGYTSADSSGLSGAGGSGMVVVEW